MTSSAAHQATRLGDLAPLTLGRMAVIGAGRVGYFTSNEFWSATAAGTQIVYRATALGWDTVGCYMRDAVIDPSGAVAFLPGCAELPIQIGSVDGGPVRPSYQPNPDMVYGERFGCGAKDPAGGFYFMVTDNWAGRNPRLVHLAKTATTPAAPTRVPTEPALGAVGFFKECSMAVAPDGVIYVQSSNQIWKVDSK